MLCPSSLLLCTNSIRCPATYHPPSASAVFTAHDGQPVILLEDFDHFIDHVQCVEAPVGKSNMVLNFGDEDAFLEAFELWAPLRKFVVVTAHPGCNPPDERGAWLLVPA